MRPVLTAEEMRRVDARAIAELGIPGPTLMENAGRGAAEALLAALPERGLRARGLRVAIVCGRGGNGGDGFVVARRLKRAGARPDVLLAAPPDTLRGDAAEKYREMRRAGIAARVVEDAAAAAPIVQAAGVVVDALLGTGARGAPERRVADLIEAINASGRPVVALDLPSGLPADGGAPEGPAVRAWLTATFAAPKPGLLLEPGAALAGRVVVVPIGVPDAEVARDARTFVLEARDVAPLFPRRARDAHKGTYGHLLVLAGSVGKTGAAALAARGALRSGVGLVTVGTAASAQPTVAALSLEAMTEPLPETGARTLAMKAREPIVALAETRDAVAIGPGLGLDHETRALARELVASLPRPMVVDADALTALADHLDVLRGAPGARVLTPHPGEMARLVAGRVEDVQRDRLGVARAFAGAHGVHLVLKGARTLIAQPDGRVLINPTGNAGLATGGTGDVLTGILGALLARGLEAAQAAPAGVYLHGLAGDVAAERVGEEALIAGDVVEALGEAFRRLADVR
ncbi:MAG TPA: NAD(P)H-hydrate dehydratase [Methylomirabilota bacterium]|jgi:NAD(P)H-hydrate epimerase|nr:NAD(P)H-hydrate dehydratase [Methylomirabilota bacterium]